MPAFHEMIPKFLDTSSKQNHSTKALHQLIDRENQKRELKGLRDWREWRWCDGVMV